MKEFMETGITMSRVDQRHRQVPPHLLNEETVNLWEIMLHDLRSSLISILATLKLLSRGYYGRMEEGGGGQVKALSERVVHLIGMSEECLDRILSAEGTSDTREVVNLRKDILYPLLEELSPEIEHRHMRIDRCFEDIPAFQTPVKANRVWLKAIFRNLLQNAIQYGDAGGTITFGFKIQGSSYRFNVYNSGKPISEEGREKLFKKTDAPAGDGGPDLHELGGMGIGLYLIKRIIRKMGGTIWYEAEEHGSNFVLTLPTEAH